jgi:hypothetical protein
MSRTASLAGVQAMRWPRIWPHSLEPALATPATMPDHAWAGTATERERGDSVLHLLIHSGSEDGSGCPDATADLLVRDPASSWPVGSGYWDLGGAVCSGPGSPLGCRQALEAETPCGRQSASERRAHQLRDPIPVPRCISSQPPHRRRGPQGPRRTIRQPPGDRPLGPLAK